MRKQLGWELADRSEALTPLVTARCLRRPLVLLLDEAHTLDQDVGQVLLSASQAVAAYAPFFLVGAAIARALGGDPPRSELLRCRDALAGTGYVWKRPAAGDAWQSGIPSLMEYVLRQAA